VRASPQVQARLKELREKVGSDESLGVMSTQERKIRLSQIARASITDFMEMGPDGTWVSIGKETPMAGAVQELHSRTEYDDNGAHSTIHTSVKLHDPMKAIDLMNKMDGVYSESPILNDNRVLKQVNIFVIDSETKGLISQVGQRFLNGHTDNQGIQSDPQGVGGEEKGDSPGGGNV